MYDGLSRWFVDKPPPEAAALLAGEARREMEAWAGRGYGSGKAGGFAAKIRSGMDHWFTFLFVLGVGPTNDRAGRALRESVV